MKATTKANENDPEPNNELCSHIIEGVSGYSRRAGKETNEPDSSKSNSKTCREETIQTQHSDKSNKSIPTHTHILYF